MGASTDRTNCAGGRPQCARSAEPFQLPRRGPVDSQDGKRISLSGGLTTTESGAGNRRALAQRRNPCRSQCRVWVAMWVQSASKKVSFCLIILARVAADTLSANALTTPSPCPGATWSYGDVSPSGFPPIAEETTTNPGGRGAACEFGLRHLIRFAARPVCQTLWRPS